MWAPRPYGGGAPGGAGGGWAACAKAARQQLARHLRGKVRGEGDTAGCRVGGEILRSRGGGIPTPKDKDLNFILRVGKPLGFKQNG